MTVAVPWGHVRIYAPDTNSSLILLLDESPPTPSGDVGGWESITVPRRRAVRYWSSTPEARLELGVIVLPTRGTVSRQIQALRLIATAGTDGDGERRPPRRVELSGQLPPLPLRSWVIDDVSWGDAIYDESNKLIRQHLGIVFGEPPDDAVVRVGGGGRSKFRNRKGKKSKPTATLLAGETLQEFSARVLGNPARWGEIAKLQRPAIKDPRRPGPAGRKLKLPRS